MSLFQSPPTTHTGPARYCESHYDYLCRTERPAFALVRELIERWLTEVPCRHRRPLISRLRSSEDHQFDAAFFELYVHALLRRLGCSVKFHPRAGGKGGRPDFLVKAPEGEGVLVEATNVEEYSDAGRAARARLEAVYDLLNEMEVPDYFFHVTHYGLPESPVPGRKLRHEIRQFLKAVDYDSVRSAATKGLNALPRMVFAHGSFSLEIALMPVSEKKRGDTAHRPVGMQGPGEAYYVDDKTPIRDKISYKAKRYGRLRRPLMIAVNVMRPHVDDLDVKDALFGCEDYITSWADGRVIRSGTFLRPDGVWLGPEGIQYRRVSAVLVVSSLQPWSVAARQPVIYHNPWARYPIASRFTQMPSYVVAGGKLIRREGCPAHSILGLPGGWPMSAGD
jgi:hypothetical protein